jgi:hypothetical protein
VRTPAINQRTALLRSPVKNKPIYQLEDGWVAYDLALLAFSGFFFSWFAAVVLSNVSH